MSRFQLVQESIHKFPNYFEVNSIIIWIIISLYRKLTLQNVHNYSETFKNHDVSFRLIIN